MRFECRFACEEPTHSPPVAPRCHLAPILSRQGEEVACWREARISTRCGTINQIQRRCGGDKQKATDFDGTHTIRFSEAPYLKSAGPPIRLRLSPQFNGRAFHKWGKPTQWGTYKALFFILGRSSYRCSTLASKHLACLCLLPVHVHVLYMGGPRVQKHVLQ